MEIAIIETAIGFLASLAVSAFIIYVTTRLFGEKEGVKTAIIAAIIGSAIYSVAYLLFGRGIAGPAIGGIGWLLALRNLYSISWTRVILIAIVIWVAAGVLSFLPTLTGPL